MLLEFIRFKIQKFPVKFAGHMHSSEAKEKVKELKDALKVEKKLVIQKDEEVQATLLKTDEEREKVIAKFLEFDRFSNL
nr:hypothetical protein CFP56_10547 [Quercus suber]